MDDNLLSPERQKRDNIDIIEYCINKVEAMTETNSTRIVRRERIFPEIQWTEEQFAQWKAKQDEFYQRCQPIFERFQPELIKTHYNCYMAVEPENGEFFVDKDEMTAIKMSRQKYPECPVFVFKINETGIAGTI